MQCAFTVVPADKRDDQKLRILFKRVHIIEMELLNDGVDDGDEPDLDDGKDVVEVESDDEVWMCDKDEEDVDPSLLWGKGSGGNEGCTYG